MRFPSDRKYTKDHEWAKFDGKKVLVGITDHAQSSLGDIVYVELPAAGKSFNAGDTFGVVESVKAASDLYAPVSGKVVRVNEKLNAEPAMLNQDPHNQGWLIELELSGAEPAELMDSKAYASLVQTL